jgi:hypothetical protein
MKACSQVLLLPGHSYSGRQGKLRYLGKYYPLYTYLFGVSSLPTSSRFVLQPDLLGDGAIGQRAPGHHLKSQISNLTPNLTATLTLTFWGSGQASNLLIKLQ